MAILLSKQIRELRESKLLTQTDLANMLSVSRASVNAWEMGISNPSLDNIVGLSRIFHISTDYLLGKSNAKFIDISDLSQEETEIIYQLLSYFDKKKTNS